MKGPNSLKGGNPSTSHLPLAPSLSEARSPNDVDAEHHHLSPQTKNLALALAALGVVFGDIGTSPLYAMKECFHGLHAIALSQANILGAVSLVFWSLTMVVSIKYVIFILRADNKGEGGI